MNMIDVVTGVQLGIK